MKVELVSRPYRLSFHKPQVNWALKPKLASQPSRLNIPLPSQRIKKDILRFLLTWTITPKEMILLPKGWTKSLSDKLSL